jgi:hypothetical protein
MSARCRFALDHDLGAAALTKHAATCDVCARSIGVRTRARRAWDWAKERDDASHWSMRDRKLRSIASLQRARFGVLTWALKVAALPAMLAVLMAVLWPSRLVGRAWRAPSQSAVQEGNAPAPQAVGAPESAPSPTPPPALFSVTGLRGAPYDGRRRALEVGRALVAGDALEVPGGAAVDVSYLVDTASRIGISGPAEADVREERSNPVLVLRRGAARVTSASGATVLTEAVRTRGEHASWLIEVRDAHTRVTALKGTVAVESATSDQPQQQLRAGEEVAIDANGHGAVTVSKAVPEEGTATLWRAAEKALDEGDRQSAEQSFRAALEHDPNPARRARAELRLGELLLARGAREEARARLQPLVFGGDTKLAADAVWLLARCSRVPRERADIWAAYLATSPPSSMRQLALIERATALEEAGDTAGAISILHALDGETLTPVASTAVRALRARLGAKETSE